MLKKIVATSVLSASILGANAGITEAAAPDQQQPQVHVYTQYAQVQLDPSQLQGVLNNCGKQLYGQLDPALQNKIQELLKQFAGQHQQQPQEEAPQKAEQPEKKQEKAEQPAPTPAPEQKQEKAEKPAPAPAPEKEAAPAPEKQTQPEPEQKPAAEQPAPEQQPAQQPTQQQPAEQPAAEQNTETGFQLTADEQQMVNLVNQARKEAGLAPLKVDPELTKMARAKAKDMIQNNYFSHNSPTYGSPFDMMKKFGIEYRTAGENIAGNSSVQGAHTALMNSEGHRANILGSQYTKIGIGIVDGGPYGKMFAQEFIG